MGMAAISDSPVIVVGDIDRGGVFASLYGTIALLRPEERRRIQGIIINKFRGDISILESGLTMLEELTGVPVLGVLPYLNLHLEEEDSLAEQLSVQTADGTGLDIAVIRLPRIANFTDFAALSGIEGVSVRYVTRRAELGTPDLLILPGTKNTLSDLRWLRESGLEAAILKLHEKGCLLFASRFPTPTKPRGAAACEGWDCWTWKPFSNPKSTSNRYKERLQSHPAHLHRWQEVRLRAMKFTWGGRLPAAMRYHLPDGQTAQ